VIATDVRLDAVTGRTHAEQILAVHEAAARHAYGHIFSGPFPSACELVKWAAHDGPVVAALRQDEVIGFAAATGETLEGLFVLPFEAGAGIGTALLDAIGPVTRLWVLAENTTARAFYERRRWHWSGAAEACAFADDVTKLLYVRQPPVRRR
jgi:GNAT superfamily N-acetyltransferase